MEKTKQNILQLFWLVLFFVLAVILFGAWLANGSFSYSVFIVGVVIAGWLGVFAGAYYALGKVQASLYKFKYIILAAFLGVLALVYGAMAVPLQQTLVGDLGDIYKGAVIWTVQGNSEAFESFRTYFYVYPNNLGLFVVLQGLFRLLYRFGAENFYFAAVALNIVSILAGVLFLFLYVDETYGTRKAVFALVLFAGYLPMYFFSSVFYTDTMCFAFLPAVLYINKKAGACKNTKKRILLYAVMALTAALGYQIKPTVYIVTMAVLLETLFTEGIKPLCTKLVCFAVALAAINMLLNVYIYDVEKFADRAAMQENAIPATHWIMMGLNADGD
ncbi:MAG: glycosyltransferase family 39 protein, partial [Oscillospiraceae bacterium]|nr:glycosyltransferase family 39 protein [Oscillospiraceae bacterium]